LDIAEITKDSVLAQTMLSHLRKDILRRAAIGWDKQLAKIGPSKNAKALEFPILNLARSMQTT
jgi:hypothetical protein